MKPQFPPVLDGTMLSDLRACERKFFYARVEGLAPPEPSIHLHAGKCMASALDAYRQVFHNNTYHGDPAEIALATGIRTLWQKWGDPRLFESAPKSLLACTEAFIGYWQEFPLDTDSYQLHRNAYGKPSTEFSFSLPLGVAHPETGEELLYAGRFDAIVQDPVRDSFVLPLDDKTTGQLGTNWPEQWNLRGQFLGYTYALRSAGYNCDSALVRGIFIGKGPPRIVQKEVSIPHWLQDRWWDQTREEVEDLVQNHRNANYRYNFSDACTAYGGCDFRQLCLARYPQQVYSAYIKRRWNPLSQTEETEDV